jgi:hypothetical protein
MKAGVQRRDKSAALADLLKSNLDKLFIGSRIDGAEVDYLLIMYANGKPIRRVDVIAKGNDAMRLRQALDVARAEFDLTHDD